MHNVSCHDARGEAARLVGRDSKVRVLEPSPPANGDPNWYADDPTAPDGETEIVTPIPGEGITWAELGDERPTVGAFAHDHWLDGHRRLGELTDTFIPTRKALHQIAFFAVAPKRFAVTGKLGLRFTHQGFGTPFFLIDDHDEQVRVERNLLVHQIGGDVRIEPVTTVAAACEFLGIEYRPQWFDGFHDPLEPVPPTENLHVEPDAAGSLGSWFGFGTHVLERARRIDPSTASRVQLWPEHFDPAIELGDVELGTRASYGASPGDASHPSPYLYVSPQADVGSSEPFWNAESFGGAVLGWDALLRGPDPYGAAVDFFRTGFRLLTS
jgi:hypothetical protein